MNFPGMTGPSDRCLIRFLRHKSKRSIDICLVEMLLLTPLHYLYAVIHLSGETMWTNDMTTKIRTTIPHIVFQLLDSVLEVIRCILNTRKCVSSGYPNTEKWVEKTKMRYSFRYNMVN